MRALLLITCFAIAGYSLADQPTRQISVTGSAEVRIEPDLAKVYLNAQAQHQSSTEAKALVDQQINRLIATLESVGLDEQNLTSSQISLSPRYNYRNDQREFIGYFASRDVQVEVPDLDLLNPLLDAALREGIEGLQRIEYRSSREFEMEQEARAQAIADSKQQAATIAEAYGMRLGPVISIQYHNSNPVPLNYAQPQMERAMLMADTAGAAPFTPDQLVFRDNISVIFELLID